ncbi:methyl-accepting chemotaxis protein [Actimicrobium sp. GrIS 1.19]|uniref:methyl-accepting chemotaxis protein n=1 Tax=Actimicrobium sp. GrIS 1.19 TaxID=3071708 RepID=UPI002DFF2918|nr:methyl-accepting chemotaxis protein [Actimicrobium sp. GrIS 1.19]
MKMTLKAQLSTLIALLFFISVVIGLLGLYGMSQANDGLKTVYEDRTVALEQVSRIDRLLVRNRLALAESLLDANASTIKVNVDLIEANTAEIGKTWTEYVATYLTPEEKTLADKFASDRGTYLKEGLLPAVAALKAGKTDAAAQLYKQFPTLFKPVREGINALRKLQVDEAKKEYERSSAHYVSIRSIVFGAILFGGAIAALAGFFLIRKLYRQLGGEPEYASQIVKYIAAGDLTVNVNTRHDDKESLLFSMKEMQQNLSKTIGAIRQSTDTIATASAEIASGNMDLSSRTEQQASSLEETASSMEELTSTVKQNAENAHQANSLAKTASEVASKGGAVMVEVVGTMNSIDESARKIVDIISVIDGIAFQTNILALNAAVEAARAGEQGRGFAVVASEVRNLAQRSAGAAKEIKALIGDSVEKVAIGSKLVAQAGVTMAEVVDSVKRVTDIISDIAAAGMEQTAGIEQINIAITEMDNVTQQNAALVEQAAAAAESLQDQAGSLVQFVSVFKTDGALPSAAAPVKLNSEQQHRTAALSAKGVRTTRRPAIPVRSPVSRALVASAVTGTASSQWEEF